MTDVHKKGFPMEDLIFVHRPGLEPGTNMYINKHKSNYTFEKVFQE